MNRLRILTLNLLNDDFKKEERINLFIDQVKKIDPDIIALQEVDLANKIHRYIKTNLNGYHTKVCSRPDHLHQKEGLMLLSKYKIKNHHRLVLDKQQRIAQLAEIKVGGKSIQIANVHMHWSLVSDIDRLRHITEVIDSSPRPQVILGDFNATPRMMSIKRTLKLYTSVVSVDKNTFSYPSPLKRTGPRALVRRLSIFLLGLVSHLSLGGWRGMIDYILIDKQLKVISAMTVLDLPSKSDNNVYVSDHLGVLANIEI